MKNLFLTTALVAVTAAGAFAGGKLPTTLEESHSVIEFLDDQNDVLAAENAELKAQLAAVESDEDALIVMQSNVESLTQAIEGFEAQKAKDQATINDQNSQIQALAAYNADIKAELLKTATRMLNAERALEEAQAELAAPNESAEVLAGIQEVITDHKAQAGANFAKDPVGYITFAFNYLEDRVADLKNAEDHIRDLEEQIEFHKEGGYWNPTNW